VSGKAGSGRCREVSLQCAIRRNRADKLAGNQYGIKNELDKPARVFFSQGCKPAPFEEE
jgi:hypothetical protein